MSQMRCNSSRDVDDEHVLWRRRHYQITHQSSGRIALPASPEDERRSDGCRLSRVIRMSRSLRSTEEEVNE